MKKHVLYTLVLVSAVLASFIAYEKEPQDMEAYVLKYQVKPPGGSDFKRFLPDDSIFLYKGFGMEKILRSTDMISDTDIREVESLDRYYCIDFSRMQFADLGPRLLLPDGMLAWKAIKEKKLGLQFDFPYYNGEAYTSKDSTINGEKVQLIRFRYSATGPHQNSLVTIYLQEGKDVPAFFKKVEDAFPGKKVKKIQISYPGQGDVLLSLNTISCSPRHEAYQALKQIAARF